jgi:hypothetical protein
VVCQIWIFASGDAHGGERDRNDSMPVCRASPATLKAAFTTKERFYYGIRDESQSKQGQFTPSHKSQKC